MNTIMQGYSIDFALLTVFKEVSLLAIYDIVNYYFNADFTLLLRFC